MTATSRLDTYDPPIVTGRPSDGHATTGSVNVVHSRVASLGIARDPLSRFGRPNSRLVLASCLGFVATTAFIDWVTGRDLQLVLFYGLTVVAAAWFGSRRMGMATVAVVTAMCLLLQALDSDGVRILIALANVAFQACFFLIVVWVVERERTSVDDLHRLATRDGLTDAQTRRAFFASTSDELLRAKRHPEPITVVFLDVDGLKQVNDQFGHDRGDSMLQTVARSCEAVLRATDRLGRLGGDEFAILLPRTDAPEAATVVSRVQQALLDDRITASFGVATFLQPPSDAYVLINAADACMYEAKRAGSGQVARTFRTDAAAHIRPPTPHPSALRSSQN